MPREVLAKSESHFIHKIIIDKKPSQIHNLLKYPVRSRLITTPQLINQQSSEHSKQGLLYKGLQIYNEIDQSVRDLPVKTFKSIIFRHLFDVLSKEDQKN